MRKALCLVEAHPEIKAKLDEVEAMAKELSDRMDFLQRQLKQHAEKLDIRRAEVWKEIDVILFEKGLTPPEYLPEKHNLQYDKEGGVLFWGDKSSDSDLGRKLAEFLLSGLLK